MNLKKLFATTLTVLMVATMFPVNLMANASYSDELEGAYDYAFSKGATTMDSIDESNVYGTLIRSHMAKMLSAWGTEVLGLTPDTSKDCEFTDIENQTQEMQDYILEACQLGLMGVWITEFRPNDKVTRAEFGTVLSRALRGDKYNGGTPYYADHLEALQDANVMNNISNPSAFEVRGYVRLMMQRADEEGVATPATCKDPMVAIACALNPLDNACPVECRDIEDENEVKAGSLKVSLNSDSLSDWTEVPSTGTVRFAVVDFKASSDDVSLKSVEISKMGLATIPSSTRVRFEKDGIRISGKAAFTSEWKAVMSFAPAYDVKAWDTATLDLYVELWTSAGQDFQFESTEIDSTAEDMNGDFTTPKLRTANYTVAPVTFDKASSSNSYNATAEALEVGAFKLTNNDASSETRDVKFQSISFRQNGNWDLNNLSDIVLVRNWEEVSSDPIINGKDMTFSVWDTIKDWTTATYYIKAVINTVDNNAWDTYNFYVRYTTDVNASEVATAFRSTVTLTTWYLNTYTINWGDVSFAKDSSIELSTNYAAWTDDVILMKGTITTKEAVTFEDPSIALSTVPASGLVNLFSTIYLKIGNSTFSYSPAAGEVTGSFLWTVTVDWTSNVKMYGKLKDTAPAQTVKFSDLKLWSFARVEYVSTSNTVSSSIGAIAWVSVSVQDSALNVTRTDALWNQYIAAWADDLVTYGIRLSTDQWNWVTVSNAKFTVTSNNTADLYNNGYLTLYVNWVAKQTKTITAGTVTFDNFNKDVTKTSPVDLVVKADLNDAFASGTLQLTLNDLDAVDTLTSNDVSGFSTPAGAVFTVATADATIAASDSNPQSHLFLSPSTNNKIAAFKMTAKNDNVRLYTINLTWAFDWLSNFKLVDASDNLIATATTATTSVVTFNQIANAPFVTKDTSVTYYLVADVNSNTNGVSVNGRFTTIDVKWTNGLVVNKTAQILSNNHAISENTMVVAKASNPDKALTTSALRFTVTAAGKDSVLLTGIKLNGALAGYTGTIVVKIYKTSINSANEAGTASLTNAADQIIALTSNSSINSTVDAWSTVTYIVALEWALVDPASNSTDWNVTLKNVYFGWVGAATYYNLGTLPMTEVK